MNQVSLRSIIVESIKRWQAKNDQSGGILVPTVINGETKTFAWMYLDSLQKYHLCLFVDEAKGQATIYPIAKEESGAEEDRWLKDPGNFYVKAKVATEMDLIDEGKFKEDYFIEMFEDMIEIVKRSNPKEQKAA